MNKRWMLRGLLLLLIAAELIGMFRLSGEEAPQSDRTSGSFIETLLQTADPSFASQDEETRALRVQRLQKGVRTLAHLSEYLLLGLLTAAFSMTFFNWRRWLLGVVGGGVLWAVLDEIHQSFVPGRSCQASDVAVDTVGILLGAALVLLGRSAVRNIRARISKRKDANE